MEREELPEEIQEFQNNMEAFVRENCPEGSGWMFVRVDSDSRTFYSNLDYRTLIMVVHSLLGDVINILTGNTQGGPSGTLN